MKETKENIALLKKLGFKEDQQGFYTNSDNWGFVIDCMPDFKTLLKRLQKSHYNDGYDDCEENKARKFGIPQDR
jgi:hypothetical protein